MPSSLEQDGENMKIDYKRNIIDLGIGLCSSLIILYVVYIIVYLTGFYFAKYEVAVFLVFILMISWFILLGRFIGEKYIKYMKKNKNG